MASKTRFVHFSSFAFLGLLVFFSIHQVSVSYLEHRTLPSTQKPTPDYGNIVSHGDFDPGHVLHDLSKRAPPETAAEALNKAEGYWCLLTNLDTNEGSNLYSKYADPKDLDKYWLSKSWPSKDGLTDTEATIPDALAAIGLPGKQGDQGLQAYYYEQDQEFNVDGVLEEATWGYYRASISPAAGYISAEDNYSPDAASGGRFRNKLPFANSLSDVYFLMWQAAAKKQRQKVTDIKYFIRLHVVNTHSKKIALEVAGNNIPFWPGVSYAMTSDEGKSILGTPNGAGVAFFLYQHKPELGVRVPTKVTLFKTIGKDNKGQPEDWYHFLFEITPYSGKKKGKGRKGKEGK